MPEWMNMWMRSAKNSDHTDWNDVGKLRGLCDKRPADGPLCMVCTGGLLPVFYALMQLEAGLWNSFSVQQVSQVPSSADRTALAS